ncbi:MAG: hypothetical protein H8F28_05100 [Fibrella sp.]|nr:hypothetical protein [Armatimonadota bacterium]
MKDMPQPSRTDAAEAVVEPGNRTSASRPPVTFRILLLGTILIFLNCYWVLEVEGIWHTNHATAMSLFWNTVFCLLLLVTLNIGLLKPFLPRFAFSQGELATCFTMMTIGTALAGHDSLQLGIPGVMGFPVWFQAQQPSLGWDKFTRFYPDWVMVKDLEVLKPAYYGHATPLLYTPKHLAAWSVPVGWWCAFTLALGAVLVGTSTILRRQWMDNEKLAYPIVQLPLALIEDGGTTSFWRNKVLWWGIAAGASLDIWNGLATLIPSMPLIAVRHDQFNLGQYATTMPWKAVGNVPFPLYPFIIALGFLLPTDLSFSLWFFYLFRLGLVVFAATLNLDGAGVSKFPFLAQQSFGAWAVICVFALWQARHHLKQAWDKAWNPRDPGIDDSDEPMSYRAAFVSILLGLTFLFYFCLRAGMSWGIVAGFFGFYFLLSVGIARIRAELGPPAHEMAFGMSGTAFLTMFLGTQGVGLQNLTILSLFFWFSGRGYRTHPMPGMLEGMRLGQGLDGKGSLRGTGYAMLFAVFVGTIASFWAALHLQYGAGINAMTNHNWGQFGEVSAASALPRPPDINGQLAMIAGGVAAFGMMYMRTQFVWWPFHPAGYAIALTYGGEYYWSCLLIAWGLKSLILRYGGIGMYRQIVPFMFGLILGEYTVGAFWSLLSVFVNSGAIINIKTYDFAPG